MAEILDIFGIDTRLLLIQAFNFGVLLIVLWYFLYRPLTNLLQERQSLIETGVKDAQAAKEEKENAEEARQSIITDATHEASIIIDRAKERAHEKEALLMEEAKSRGDRLLKETEAKAQENARHILESGKEEIARMVVLGAEKVLRNQTTR